MDPKFLWIFFSVMGLDPAFFQNKGAVNIYIYIYMKLITKQNHKPLMAFRFASLTKKENKRFRCHLLQNLFDWNCNPRKLLSLVKWTLEGRHSRVSL